MPKQTFFNLNEQKRKLIEQAALDEFSEYGYDASNMNRIVTGASIAKGSFYQYFEDKKDLYFHLIDTLITQKMKVIEPFLAEYRNKSFSDNINDIFAAGLQFADSNPKFYLLGEDFVKKQTSFIEQYFTKYSPLAMDIYASLLVEAEKKGELHDKINIELAATFINSLVNTTTIRIITTNITQSQRNAVIKEMLSFIKRAVQKSD